jgi:hypothetical protein
MECSAPVVTDFCFIWVPCRFSFWKSHLGIGSHIIPPIGGMSLKPMKGYLDNLSLFLCAEEHLEHWGGDFFFFFLLRVPVFVALAIIILKLSSKHFLSQGGG